jgi:hypothetical protein
MLHQDTVGGSASFLLLHTVQQYLLVRTLPVPSATACPPQQHPTRAADHVLCCHAQDCQLSAQRRCLQLLVTRWQARWWMAAWYLKFRTGIFSPLV